MKTQHQQLEDIVRELHNNLFVRTQHYYEVITSEEMEHTVTTSPDIT